MIYLLSGAGVGGLVLAGLLWYFIRKSRLDESAATQAEAAQATAEADQRGRTAAEDERNAALVGDWTAGMAAAKENTDAQKALDGWRAAARGL